MLLTVNKEQERRENSRAGGVRGTIRRGGERLTQPPEGRLVEEVGEKEEQKEAKNCTEKEDGEDDDGGGG